MASNASFKLLLILQFVTHISGFLDFTCFNSNPRIDINGDNNNYIAGYPSGDDKDVSISFTRRSETGTGNGVPYGSNQQQDGDINRLYMRSYGGKQRIGAFNCVAEKGGVTETITTITMATNSETIPQFVSRTVNIGESVTLAVTTELPGVAWWHDNVLRSSWDDQTSITIPSVSVNNAVIYECNGHNRRYLGIHAIFQLIVRECTSGRWGDQCQSYCPTCYNGGICDERSGQCVCAPGFSGSNCLTLHGYNHWGQDGQVVCINGNVDACRGRLFCLPHPYGCSCGAGYQGIDCDQVCQPGFYGASCRSKCHCADGVSCSPDTGRCIGGQCHPDWYGENCQVCQLGFYGASCTSECHCADGVSCSPDTGRCDGGQCHPDWYGINCQVPCPAPQLTLSNLQVTPTANTLKVRWNPIATPCSHAISYKVEYKLTYFDQCFLPMNEQIQASAVVPTSQHTIDSLDFYSTYTVYVTAVYIGQPMREGDRVETIKTTEQTVPEFTPTEVSASASTESNSLTFVWNAISCGMRRGSGLQYRYQLRIDGAIERDEISSSITETISDLLACTYYSFRVRVENDAGAGSWSQSTSITTRIIIPQLTLSITPTRNTLKVTWDPISSSCSQSISYKVGYKLTNSDQCSPRTNEPLQSLGYTGNLQYTITSLDFYSTYTVYVTAVYVGTPMSEGDTVERTQRTEEAAPNFMPTVISGSASSESSTLTFGWNAVPCGMRLGDGLRYRYQLRIGDSLVKSQEITSTTEVFSSLFACTTYRLRVRAKNNAGMSDWSLYRSESTRTITPGKVTEFTIASVSSSEIGLTWQVTSSDNACRETGYNVTYTLLNKDQCEEGSLSYSMMVSSLSSTLSGLFSYSTYNISVSAVNDAGSGDSVNEEVFTDRSHPTAPPSLVTTYDVSSSEISIQWSPPPCGSRNGPISYSYTFSNDDENKVISDSTEYENVTFRELTPFTNYTFTIAAKTDAGTGPLYTFNVSTKEAVPTAPQTFQTVEVTKTSIETSWEVPEYPNGLITKYTVQAEVIEKLYDPTFAYSPLNHNYVVNDELDKNQRTYAFADLNPSTKYELIVFASTSGGNGDPALIQHFTNRVTRDVEKHIGLDFNFHLHLYKRGSYRL